MDEETTRGLVAAAIEASRVAYSPYSDFPVGAAALASDGRVFTGCNVENASYGLTICAERNAVFQMITSGRRELAAIAIYTPTDTLTPPCGACRQVMAQFGLGAEVVVVCDGADRLVSTVSELLPSAFGLP